MAGTHTGVHPSLHLQGEGCQDKLFREVRCVASNCGGNDASGPKQDCRWSAWTEWSKECLCPSNLQRRSRTKIPAQACTEPLANAGRRWAFAYNRPRASPERRQAVPRGLV
jgi:hypothetical protein